MRRVAQRSVLAVVMLAIGAVGAPVHVEVSSAVTVDSRDYMLTVASTQPAPTPAVGTHVYAWGAKITCSVVDESATHDLLGWTGTGSVPASGTASTTGEFTLDDVDGSSASTITWDWYASPEAVDDAYAALRNTALAVVAPGVLGNDSVVEDRSLSVVKVTDPANGTLALAADGSFVYTPSAGYVGEDSFTYKANDGDEDSEIATVTVAVTGGAVCYVTTTADSGAGSLRAAIEYANVHPWTQVVFNIPLTDSGHADGVFTIQPLTPLPVLTATSASINAETQTAFSGDTNPLGPEVVLNGELAGDEANGIEMGGMSNLLRGLVVNGFARCGVVAGTAESWGQHRVEGCYVGTDPTGTTAVPNVMKLAYDLAGIAIKGGTGTVIGGTGPGAGNLASGNGSGPALGVGIVVHGATARANRIEGNRVGTDRTGTDCLPNGRGGVWLYGCGADNVVGGTDAAARNIISGNDWHGVTLVSLQSTGNTVVGNYIGTSIDGTSELGNQSAGVGFWDRATEWATIGGATPGHRNIISGNGYAGVYLRGSNVIGNLVIGNYIGTDSTGTTAIPNGWDTKYNAGVVITDSPGNRVGGPNPGEGNLISGNGDPFQPAQGIEVSGSVARDNIIQGNRIGTTADGEQVLPNSSNGIKFSGAGSGNLVGGPDPGEGNLISGNTEEGILIENMAAGGVTVQGNLLGTDPTGAVPVPNGAHGVRLSASSGHRVGGEAAAMGNRIAFNGAAGIRAESGTGNTFRSNSILANGDLGIDLSSGANDTVAAPGIDSVSVVGDGSLIAGTVAAGSPGPVTVEVFSNLVADPSGFGEGETFLGSAVAVDGAWSLAVAEEVPTDAFLTATATDGHGSTSGFSPAMSQQPPTVDFQATASVWLEPLGTAKLPVVLSFPTISTVSVDYATSDGTAIAGSDYTAISGTLTFRPGETTKWVHIPITSDTEAEGDETLVVTLTAPSNASLGSSAVHTATITDPGEAPAYLVVDLASGPDSSVYPVASLDAVPAGGWTLDDRITKLVLRRIPRGGFTMGSPVGELGREADESLHTVTLVEDFYIGVFEVTQRQWNLVMGDWPSYFSSVDDPMCRDLRPVEQVSWEDIRGGIWPGTPAGTGQPAVGTFVWRLRERTGINFDLPTEARWEYACRAGTTTALHLGEDLLGVRESRNLDVVGRYAWNHDGGYSTSPLVGAEGGTLMVGFHFPNDWGIHDMHGNVREWCLDWQGAYGGLAIDPVGAATGAYRVLRGGGWTDAAAACRSASRAALHPPDASGYNLGFRIAAAASGDPAHVVTFDLGYHGVHTHGGELVQVVTHGEAAAEPEFDVAVGWRFVGWSTGFGEVNDRLRVVARYDLGLLPGDDFVRVPAGTNVGMDPESGLYSLSVGTLYVGTCETPKSRWDQVRTWGLDNGYDDLPEGAAKGSNYPVHSISWHDAVKWCNARSEMDGRVPCYTVAGAVYRTGVDDTVACDLAVDGYRLPTETEWEYAGRGGLSGKRFPWGDTVEHGQANYWSDADCPYDISATRGHHPDWDDGTAPYTACLGSFGGNAYGLHDVAGNLSEWCTDWHPSHVESERVIRGGSWDSGAELCQVGWRDSLSPDVRDTTVGFRTCTVAPVKYTVTFGVGEKGTRTGGGELVQPVLPGHAAVAPELAIDEGWLLVGWSTDFAAVTEDLAVSAQYGPIPCTVTFDLGTHGTRTGGGELVQHLIYGQAATAPVLAVESGWAFLGWDEEFDRLTTDLQVTALYSQIIYSLTVVGGDGDGSYVAGTVVPVLADAAPEGEVFAGWNVNPTGFAGNLANPVVRSTTFTMPASDAAVTATYIPVGQDPFGAPTTYLGLGMTVLVRIARSVGEVQAGDVVGAFVLGELRGKATVVVVQGVAYANLTVYVSENGETVSFRLWSAASGEVETGDATVVAQDGTSLGTPTAPVDVLFSPTDTLAVSLAAGWNHTSLPLQPVDPSCEATFATIAPVLEKVIGGTRNYTPGWGELNTLTEIEDGLGHWINVSEATTWTVLGTPLDATSTPIELVTGWNDVAFIGPATSTADGALAGIMGQLEKVVGDGGNYTPGWGALNTLTEMRRGIGYWVKVSSATTLTYGFTAPPARRAPASPSVRAMPAWEPGQPDPPSTAHTILATATMDGNPAAAGSLLGVFVDGQCRAIGQPILLNGKAFFNLTVLMGSINDIAEFRLYDATSGVICDAASTLSLTPGGSDGTPEAPVEIAFVTPVAQHTVTFKPGFHGTLPEGDPEVTILVDDGAPAPAVPTVTPDEGWKHVGWNWQPKVRGAVPDTVVGDWTATALYEVIDPEPIWSVALGLAGAAPAALTIGMHLRGGDGWVDGLDVAGPDLPLGEGEAALISDDGALSYSVDYRAPAESAEFLLTARAAAAPVTISWAAPTLPEGKFLTVYEVLLAGIGAGRDPVARTLVGNTALDMGVSLSLTIPAGGTRSFVIRYGDELIHDLALCKGWNLVSLPIEPLDPAVDAVLGNGQGARADGAAVVAWGGVGYVESVAMHACVGYWVYAREATVLLVEGMPVVQENLELLQGWNALGPVKGCLLPLDARIRPHAWLWDAETLRYEPSDRLLPGRGHWINAGEDATIPLDGRRN